MRAARLLAAGALIAALASCDDGADKKPYLEIIGGGFIFNYRIAEAYYGIVLRARRSIPPGAVIEAEFENPGGGKPILVRQVARAARLEYSFRTPPLQGVKANQDYRVTVRLVGPPGRTLLATYTRTFRSSADQGILPKRPLTTGPGYHTPPR